MRDLDEMRETWQVMTVLVKKSKQVICNHWNELRQLSKCSYDEWFHLQGTFAKACIDAGGQRFAYSCRLGISSYRAYQIKRFSSQLSLFARAMLPYARLYSIMPSYILTPRAGEHN